MTRTVPALTLLLLIGAASTARAVESPAARGPAAASGGIPAEVAAALASHVVKVTTYRVSVTPTGDPAADASRERDAVRSALAGATQSDARRRLAALGDVSTALPRVAVDTSDDEANTVTLAAGRTTYVKEIPGRGGVPGDATLGHIATGSAITLTAAAGDVPRTRVEAHSIGVSLDRLGEGDVAVDLPTISRDAFDQTLDLPERGVLPVTLMDRADPTGRSAIVYVISREG